MLPERPVGLVLIHPMNPSLAQPLTKAATTQCLSEERRRRRAERRARRAGLHLWARAGSAPSPPQEHQEQAAAAPAPRWVTRLAQMTDRSSDPYTNRIPSTHSQDRKCQALSALAISPVFYFPCLTWYKWEKRDNNRPLHPCARQSPTIMEISESWNIWIQFHTLLLF